MYNDPVARVYAQALLEMARRKQEVGSVGQVLEHVAAAVAGDRDLGAFLRSPALDAAAKKAVLEGLRARAGDLLVDFLCVLVDNGRIGELGAIARGYRDLADAEAGRVRVRATMAVAIDDGQRRRLETVVQETLKRECVVETEVRPDLVGGLVLQVGDKIYDGTVRQALRRVRAEMTRSSGYEG